MVDQEGRMEIQILHRQGVSQHEIAWRTGLSRNTVKKCLTQQGSVVYGLRAVRRSNQPPSEESQVPTLEPSSSGPWPTIELRLSV